MTNLHRWPFRPVHITNDGELFPDKCALAGEGVLPNKLMNVHQTAMCVTLDKPTTIIEFAPFSEETPLEGRECVRTDSPLLGSTISPMCREFRRWTNNQCCHQCENVHARLLSGLTREEVHKAGKERIQNDLLIQRLGMSDSLQFGCVDDRPYLEYSCPFLGYRELIFPIFFGQDNKANDKVLAAYFVGQLCITSELSLIEEQQQRFFENPAKFIEAHQLPDESLSPAIMGHRIRQLHDDWVKQDKVMNEATLGKLIHNVNDELEYFETILQDNVTLQEHEYVRKEVNRTLEYFDSGLAEELQFKQSDGLVALWEHVENSMKLLNEAFGIQYAIVFGRTSISSDNLSLLPIAAKVGEFPKELESSFETINFDISKLPQELLFSNGADPKLKAGLKGIRFDESTMRLRYLPVGHPRNMSTMVILFKYGSNNNPHLKVNALNGYSNSTLRSFFSLVQSSVESYVEAITRTNMENVIRIFGHEAAQLTAGMDWTRSNYFRSAYDIKQLSDKKLADIQHDMDGYIRLLVLLTSNSKAIQGKLKVTPTSFKPFKELIYKWKDVYRQQALLKSLQFHIPPVREDDPMRTEMFADKALIEQLLYNLVGNAIKYCYNGTKIHMDCEKIGGMPNSPYILTVRNYGISIEESRRIYDLYYRGARKQEGLGIGMFVAKQIAEAHQGIIEHKKRLLSDYNIPLLEPYLKLDPKYQEPGLANRIMRELERLKKNGNYERVVSSDENGHPIYPVRPKILGEIRVPTYEVTFTVTIPQGGAQ